MLNQQVNAKFIDNSETGDTTDTSIVDTFLSGAGITLYELEVLPNAHLTSAEHNKMPI